jgi:16S rRNA A1518/A1519 N6-dimethyltransferase RsmA/KsgA/DIM1 with predicted DNA glycosylase/AP lyase activity
MLKNALARSRVLKVSQDALDEALRKAEIDGRRRAETLNLEEFLVLAKVLRNITGG